MSSVERFRCLRALISILLSMLSNTMSMLVISMTLMLVFGDIIAKLENLGDRGRNDSLLYAMDLMTSGNFTDTQLSELLETWSERNRWNIEEGVYYTFSLFSTIGYGKHYPVTMAARSVSGVFIVLFVPVGVLHIHNLCRVYQSMLSRLLISWRLRLNSQHRLSLLIFPNGDDAIIVIPITLLTLVFHTHLLSSILFLCLIENWTPIQSLYYLISSFTTIGFGDFHTGSHSLLFVMTMAALHLHLGAVFMLIINYLNDAVEWILQSAQSHRVNRDSGGSGFSNEGPATTSTL